MQTVHLPDGTTLNFPDGMSQEAMRAAAESFAKAHRPALAQPAAPQAPAEPDFSAVRSSAASTALLGAPPPDARQTAARARLADIREHGDINPSDHAEALPAPGPLSRLAESAGLRDGGNDLQLGSRFVYPLAEGLDYAGGALGQSVVRPAVGLFARAVSLTNPDPVIREDVKGTAADIRKSLDEGFQGTRENFLAAHPSGAGPALGLGTEFAAQSVPFLPGAAGATARLGEGVAGLAGRLAPETFEAGSAASRMLTHAAGGAAFGGLLGYANADPSASVADQAREVGVSAFLGGAMGGLGGAREVAGMEAAGMFEDSGRLKKKFALPPPPPEKSVAVARAWDAERKAAQAQAKAPGPPDPGAPPPPSVEQVDAQWHPALAMGGLMGDEALGRMADETQASQAPKIEAQPILSKSAEGSRRFKTALGSEYELLPDGTTIRNKAPRPDHPDYGLKSQSEKTFYVSPGHAEILGEIQANGPRRAVVLSEDGAHATLKYLEGPFAGKVEKRTVVPIQHAPEVGLQPVELWRGGEGVHFGNTIVEIGPESSPVSAASKLKAAAAEAFGLGPELPLSPIEAKLHAFAAEHGYDHPADLPDHLLSKFEGGEPPQAWEGRTIQGEQPPPGYELNLFGRTVMLPDPLARLRRPTPETTRPASITPDLIDRDPPLAARSPEGKSLAEQRPGEAGFIRIGRSKPPPPPADPFDAVMPRGERPAPGQTPLARLQRFADSVTDQWFNREDAPLRRLRRAGMAKEADYLEKLQGRARGAGGMIDPARRTGPVYDGTYVFDPDLHGPGQGGSRRTGDGLQAVIGGMDDQAIYDLDVLMAAQHHMELVGRKDAAQLQYEWNRAQRLQEIRQARLADKESLRSMFGDIRQTRAEELAATRDLSAAQMAAKIKEAVARQEAAHAEDIRARARAVEERTLDAAQDSADNGAELVTRSQEAQQAATYARQLLRQELAAAIRTPRPGEIPPLDMGAGPRSPGAVMEADRMQMALRGVAEKVGVSDGALQELLLRGREMDSLLRDAQGSASKAEAGAGAAWSVLGNAIPEQRLAREAATGSIASAQRVAMGIRDQAAKFRAPEVERHPDALLHIHPEGTRLAQQMLADLERRYGTEQVTGSDGKVQTRIAGLDDVADKVRDWSIRSFLIPLKEAGRLSDQEFTYQQLPDGTFDYGGDIVGKNRQYAPFYRLVDRLGEDPEILSGTTKVNPIKAISGGLSPERPIDRPLNSFVQQAQRVTLWTERQRVRNIFADAVDAEPALQAEIVKLAPTAPGEAPRPRGGTFPVWRDGKRYEYAAPADVNLAFERLTPAQAGHVAKIASLAARTLRAGATITLEFPFRNLGRDIQDSAVYGPGGARPWNPLIDSFAGLLESARNGKWAQEWRANGGSLSGATSVARPALEATVREAASNRRPGIARSFAAENSGLGFREGLRQKPVQTVVRGVIFAGLHPMEFLAEHLEAGTKIGVYKSGRLSGLSPLDAAVLSRDSSSPDFGRAGTFGQKWNQVEAFSNAELQDLYRFGRAMRRRPVATTVKAMTYLTIPAIANWAKNKNDPEYQNLPDWEKTAFYHPVKLDHGRWVRIPRPLGILNLAFSYGPQKFLEGVSGEDPEAANRFANGFIQQTPLHYLPWTPISGGSLDILPSAIQPAVESAAGEGGYSSFKQGPIVPQGLQGELPEDRFNDYTSGPARAIGGALGVAPLKVDSLIQGYGAYWGRTGAQAIGAAARLAGAQPDNVSFAGRLAAGGSPELPIQAQDIPGVRGFVSSSAIGFASDPVTRFYKLSTEASQAKQSMDAAVKAGDGQRFQAIVREHPEIALEDLLSDNRQQLKELRDLRKEIMSAPGLDPQTRLDQILAIDQAATQLSGVTMHMAADYLRNQRK